MLKYDDVCKSFPSFPELEPDTEIILYIKATTAKGIYSAQMIKYGVGMLKFILARPDKKYIKEYEILEKAYTEFNKKNN